MSTTTKKKYIESHWAIFVLKGALASVAGLCLILTFNRHVEFLTRLVGYFMMALGVIELFNVLHRTRRQRSWGIPLAVAIVELMVATFMLLAAVPDVAIKFFPNQEYKAISGQLLAIRVVVLSCYTLYASIASLLLAMGGFDNRTDRFIWLIEGGVGVIMALCMFADNGLDANTHLRVFGIYLLVKGVTDMIFGVHARDLALDDEDRKITALLKRSKEKSECKTSEVKKIAKKSTKTNKKSSK